MEKRVIITVLGITLYGMLALSELAHAHHRLGTGNSSLLGGDLTDPNDTVKEKDKVNYGEDKSENDLKPLNGNWLRMKSAPNNPPGTAPHQRHPYQSWQGAPACAIFLNNPEKRKWYVGFRDGGNGGPTKDAPYYCAVEFKDAFVLTHFTITTAPDMPGRDPKVWAIQGSNSGRDDDWTDIYRCDAKDRERSSLSEKRSETTLFTSFTTADMAKVVTPEDLKKLSAKLKEQKIDKADFPLPKKAYPWFRIVTYSCFNPNSTTFDDFNRPPGFSLGQLELFGVKGVREKPAPIKMRSYDPPFIISAWSGPTASLERYKEYADCGFNLVLITDLKRPAGDAALAKAVGIKAIVADKQLFKFKPEHADFAKNIHAVVAKYANDPTVAGLYLADEPGADKFAELKSISDEFEKANPKMIPFINLLPTYAPPVAMGTRSYEEYVRRYIQAINPPFVCWDHYALLEKNATRPDYFENLEVVSRVCRERNLPFVQVICSVPHGMYRPQDEADIRWQVYTTLAYGAKGIIYFTYTTPRDDGWGYKDAILNGKGEKTERYGYVQRMNRKLNALAPWMVKLQGVAVAHSAPIPRGGSGFDSTMPVASATGGTMSVGWLQDADQKDYLFVVNRHFGLDAKELTLVLRGKASHVAEISQESGELSQATFDLEKRTLTVKLLAGEGKLFRLSETGITVSLPSEFFGGKDLELNNIGFIGEKPDSKATGKLFWRHKGEATFAGLPLESVTKDRFKVTLPASVTKAPFEYYLEMHEPGVKPTREPMQGAEAPLVAIPDLTSPTAVPELVAAVAKSYRVSIGWKPATDDRKVVEYRVHRGAADQFKLSEKTLLAKLPAEMLSYTDNAPTAKQSTWYAVHAIDVVGREGEVRYLRVEVPDHQSPTNSLKVVAMPGSKSVMLSWTGEWEPIVSAFEIHRGEGKDGEMKKVGEISDLKLGRFLDKETKFGTEYRYAVRPRSSAGLLSEPGKVVMASPLRYLKRINCGGPEVATDDGVHWEADTGDGHPSLKFGGTSVWNTGSNVSKDVYQSERWANHGLGYEFKVDPGRYEVVLLFSETNSDFAGKGKRLFDIVINDKTVAEKVDVFTEAGGQSKPWQFRTIVEVKGRELEVKLLANPVGPALKGIEIRGLAAK